MPQSGLKRGGLNRQRNWRGPQEAESIQTSSNIASVMRAARTRSPRRRAGPETVSKGPSEADYGQAHAEDSHLKPVVDVVSTQYDEKSRMNDDRIGKESFGHTGQPTVPCTVRAACRVHPRPTSGTSVRSATRGERHGC